MKFRIAVTALLVSCLAFPLSSPIAAAATAPREPSLYHGRFAAGFYSVDDDADAGDVTAFHLYYRVIGEQLIGYENISFNVDGRLRGSDADYNDEAPTNRLLMANVTLKDLFKGHVDIIVGRTFIKEFVSQNVDGADVRFKINRSNGVGFFGGLRPNPYDDSFDFDFQTAGAYLFAGSNDMSLSGGYSVDLWKGDKDRERANAALTLLPSTQWFHFNASMDLDNDFDVHEGEGGPEGWEMTNLLLDGNFRPSDLLVFSFSFNSFRAINREASFEHVVGDHVLSEENYYIGRFSAEIRPIKKLAVYGGADVRHRDEDGQDAFQFYGGIRAVNLIQDLRLDLRYSNLDWFTATVSVFKGSVGYRIAEIDFDAAVTYMLNSQEENDVDLSQMIYDFSVNWWLTKKIYLTGSFSYSAEEYIDLDVAYASRYDNAYSTTAIYFQAGYRF
jgi:hypothetical protein